MQISFHELKDEVEVPATLRLYHPLQLHDVLVAQLVQDTHLPVGPLRVNIVLEGVEYLLQGVLPPRFPVGHLPDVPVGPTPQVLLNLEHRQDMVLYFLAHYI